MKKYTSDYQFSEVERVLNRWQSAISLPNLFIFLACYLLLFFYVDRPLAEFFQVHKLSILVSFVNFTGIGVVYIAAFFILAVYFWFVTKSEIWARRMAWMSAWIATAYASCGVLKVLFGRARPILWLTEKQFGFFGLQFSNVFWSFPSGHTATFISVALGLSMLFPKYRKPILLLGLVFSLTRVTLTEHYLSDVLATMVLIFVLFVGVMSWLQTKSVWKKMF